MSLELDSLIACDATVAYAIALDVDSVSNSTRLVVAFSDDTRLTKRELDSAINRDSTNV